MIQQITVYSSFWRGLYKLKQCCNKYQIIGKIYAQKNYLVYLEPNMRIQSENMPVFVSIFKNKFFKSYLPDNRVEAILQNAQLLCPNIYETIFTHGDKINEYFFLITGLIGLLKGCNKPKQTNDNYQFEILQDYKVIGQYFWSLHTLRECTAIIKSQNCQIVKINKSLFDQTCSDFVAQYNQVDRYAKSTLKLPKKINSFQLFTYKSYRLGRNIKLDKEIGVILKGQCKVLMTMENKKQKQQSTQNLPPIYKVKQKSKIKEVALLSNNQWIFTENLQEQFKDKFSYVVCSENLSLVSISINHADILESIKLDMLRNLHHQRKQRVSLRERLNTDFSSPISNSPGLKNKLIAANKVLQKLDPNFNPSSFLKKYKLGYNYIRSENREKQQRNSLISEAEQLKKQKSERKLIQYIKAKDWSHYVKIPISKA